MTSASAASFQPLAGITVVALEQAIAMPYCTFMLAEMGAEVIKIERVGTGDVVRGWDDAVRGLSTGFVWVNANKKSVALDLQSQAHRDALRERIRTADVFVENLTPGAAARLGLSPTQLCAEQPALVACSISGYGQDGPYRDVKSYDLTVQGEAGILLSNGYPSMPAKVGLPITDLIAGSNAAFGIMTRLFERQRTGLGGYLDVAMLDSALPWLGYFPHHAWHHGKEPPLSGMRHQYLCPYGPYLASDDQYVCLVIADDVQWRRFCTLVVRREDWLADERLDSIKARRQNRAYAEATVEAVIAEHPAALWITRLREAGIPFGEVRNMQSVLQHPQAQARQMFVTAASPVGDVPLVRFPLAPTDKPRRLPALGEHTQEVLRVPS